jgi:hypothetical protein
VPGFGVASTVDKVGFWATVGVGAAFATHGFLSLAQRWWREEHHPAARERTEEAQRREDARKDSGPDQGGGAS